MPMSCWARSIPSAFAGGTIALDVEAAEGALDARRRPGPGPVGRRWRPTASTRWSTRTWPMPPASTRSSAAPSSTSTHADRLRRRARRCMPRGVAEKLGIKRVIVPPNAGVGSAVGFLRAPVAYELVRSRYMRLDALRRGARPTQLLAEMSARGDGAGGARCARHDDLRAPRRLHALCRPGPRDRGVAAGAAL